MSVCINPIPPGFTLTDAGVGAVLGQIETSQKRAVNELAKHVHEGDGERILWEIGDLLVLTNQREALDSLQAIVARHQAMGISTEAQTMTACIKVFKSYLRDRVAGPKTGFSSLMNRVSADTQYAVRASILAALMDIQERTEIFPGSPEPINGSQSAPESPDE